VPPSELASVCPELERLILRMLSKEPGERLSAEENARSLEALLKSGVPQLAGAIVPTAAQKETQKASRPGPRQPRGVPPWLARTGSSALGALLALGVWSLATWALRAAGPAVDWVQWEEREEAGGRDTPSGLADAGVEESALAAVHAPSGAQIRMPYIMKEMPSEPFKGQRKPPCTERGEVVLKGACWVRVHAEKPPCGSSMFDHEDGCYIPSFNAPRQPTSGEP
jgi:eukaryotic-like serine/threonine-protein kinase